MYAEFCTAGEDTINDVEGEVLQVGSGTGDDDPPRRGCERRERKRGDEALQK